MKPALLWSQRHLSKCQHSIKTSHPPQVTTSLNLFSMRSNISRIPLALLPRIPYRQKAKPLKAPFASWSIRRELWVRTLYLVEMTVQRRISAEKVLKIKTTRFRERREDQRQAQQKARTTLKLVNRKGNERARSIGSENSNLIDMNRRLQRANEALEQKRQRRKCDYFIHVYHQKNVTKAVPL